MYLNKALITCLICLLIASCNPKVQKKSSTLESQEIEANTQQIEEEDSDELDDSDEKTESEEITESDELDKSDSDTE